MAILALSRDRRVLDLHPLQRRQAVFVFRARIERVTKAKGMAVATITAVRKLQAVLNLQNVAFLRDHFVKNRADNPPQE